MAIYNLGRGMQRIDVAENHAKNNLQIGQMLKLEGYDGDYYIILKNLGIDEKWSSYGTKYEKLSLHSYKRSTSSAYELRPIAEKFGIGVYIIDKIATPEEIMDALDKEKEQRVKDAQAVEIKETKAKEYKERILKEYAHLEKVEGYNGVKIGAKNIRTELKKAFPGIKFSVLGKHYSMGNSINVSWTDGPTSEAVDKIIDKYNEGSFDGMTDCYNYSNDIFNDIFGGAKHVHSNRHLSNASYNKIALEMSPQTPATFNPKTGGFDGVNYDIGEIIKRETWKRAF